MKLSLMAFVFASPLSHTSAIPGYLAIHGAMQKVLQKSGKQYKYHVLDCILGPLR